MRSFNHSLNLPLAKGYKKPASNLIELASENPLVVLRQKEQLSKEDFLDFCKFFGKIMEWDFGPLFDLQIDTNPQNYLFARGSVPFHWDGAFAEKEPRYMIFYCQENTVDGGETLFCNTPKVCNELSYEIKTKLESTKLNYSSEKVAHYGGSITESIITERKGKPVIRFAEPHREDTHSSNPVNLKVVSSDLSENTIVDTMRGYLYDERWTYSHSWEPGDILIADNHKLLHARNKMSEYGNRRLWRVHVL